MRQRVRRHRRRRKILEHNARDSLDAAQKAAAGRATLDMAGDDKPAPRVERAGRISSEGFVSRMMPDRHDRSPTRSRNLDMAILMRDFTVPSGMPSVFAISAWGCSSKKDSSITLIWSGGN